MMPAVMLNGRNCRDVAQIRVVEQFIGSTGPGCSVFERVAGSTLRFLQEFNNIMVIVKSSLS